MTETKTRNTKYIKNDIIAAKGNPNDTYLVLGYTGDAAYYKVKNIANGNEFFWPLGDCNCVTDKVDILHEN